MISTKKKKLFKIDEIDVNKTSASEKEPYDTEKALKYFIGLLCINVTQIIGFAKYFKDSKTMSFKIIDKKLLKNHIKIWKKITSLIG